MGGVGGGEWNPTLGYVTAREARGRGGMSSSGLFFPYHEDIE